MINLGFFLRYFANRAPDSILEDKGQGHSRPIRSDLMNTISYDYLSSLDETCWE